MYNPPLPVRIHAEAEVSHLVHSEFSRIPGRKNEKVTLKKPSQPHSLVPLPPIIFFKNVHIQFTVNLSANSRSGSTIRSTSPA